MALDVKLKTLGDRKMEVKVNKQCVGNQVVIELG